MDDVGHHRVDPLRGCRPEHVDRVGRQRPLVQNARPHRVVDVVVDVGDDVGDARDLAFDRARTMLGRRADRQAVLALRVPRDAVAHLPREIQPLPAVLEHVDDAQALLVVAEAARHELVDDALAGMTERRMAEVVTERDRFGQFLVQAQDLRDAARDLRHLERVRQPRAVVIAGRREEDLRLVLQPPKRLRVNDAIAVALKDRPDGIVGSGRRRPRLAALLAASGARNSMLAGFELFANR